MLCSSKGVSSLDQKNFSQIRSIIILTCTRTPFRYPLFARRIARGGSSGSLAALARYFGLTWDVGLPVEPNSLMVRGENPVNAPHVRSMVSDDCHQIHLALLDGPAQPFHQ